MSRRVCSVALSILVISLVGFSSPGPQTGIRARKQDRLQTATFQQDLSSAPKYVPGQIIVRFKPDVSDQEMSSLHDSFNAKPQFKVQSVNHLQLVTLSKGVSVESGLQFYRSNPRVLYAEPNFVVHALTTPNDPKFPIQWNLQNTGQSGGTPGADIHAPAAWALTTGSSSVVVAVIDSGADYTHPDLAANIWSASVPFSAKQTFGATVNCPAGSRGFNAAYGTCDPQDDNGHGTHVSGIVGAAGNNGVGVVGVNWNVKILPCKFLDSNGGGDVGGALSCLDLIRSLKTAGENIVVSNNSWGGTSFSQALHDAIDAQRQSGILFVAAAGNEFSDNDKRPIYPANIFVSNVISVASSTRYDDLSFFSNFGLRSVHLAAPGEEILSMTPNDTYSVFSGTSMAAPHVAGVAALLAAQNPTLDWRGIKNLLLAGGDASPEFSQTISGRRLNADGAMNCSNRTVQSRLSPAGNVVSGAVGQPIQVTTININCAQGAGDVTVQVSPGSQTFTLTDLGTGGDQVAGDGMYSGQWIPGALGSYTLTFPWGDSIEVEVLSSYGSAPDVYSYENISGTNLDLGDDTTTEITSPFPILFGGGTFSLLNISANGTLSFTDAYAGYVPHVLPVADDFMVGLPVPVTLVAPYWQDLFPVRGTSQNVFWQVTGTAPTRKLVIEWRDVRSFFCRSDPAATVKFQVVFQEGLSDVRFNHADVTFGGNCAFQDRAAAATVGLQESPTAAQMWSQGGPAVGDSSSILWQLPATNPQPNPVPVLTSISPTSAILNGPDFILTVNGSNFTPASRIRWAGVDHATQFVSSTQLTTLIQAYEIAEFTRNSPGTVSVFTPGPGGGLSATAQFTLLLPLPVLMSLSPSSAPAGGLSFVIEITGSGFVFGAGDVRWNGTSLLAFRIDQTRIRAQVPFGLIANPGTAQITVTNQTIGGGGGTSNALTFTITAPQQPQPGLADPVQRLDAGSRSAQDTPRSRPMRFAGWKYGQTAGPAYTKYFAREHGGIALPAASSNKTKASLLAEVRSTVNASLSSPGNLPGFALREPLPADFIPTGIAAGDFNRDGKMDWVVCHGGSDNLWIYFGKGDGTAQLPITIPLKGFSPLWVTAVDLRKSGILDLVVAEADSGTVGVLIGNGDGTFAPEVLYDVPGPALSVAAGDFDGDGKMDVVAGIIGNEFTGPFAVLRGDGTGKLGRPIAHAPDSIFGLYATFTVEARDLNGDGLSDLVVVDQGVEAGVFVYLCQGGGTFKLSQFVFGAGPSATPLNAVTGDMNEDGCLDIVAATDTGGAFVFNGHCDGSFEGFPNVLAFGAGEAIWGLAVTDLNGDGHLDIVGSGIPLFGTGLFGEPAGNLVSVLLGDGHSIFSQGKVFRGEPAMFSLAVADLNGDGRPDVLTANQDNDTASVFMNDGQGDFGGPTGAYIGYAIGGVQEGPINAPFTTFIVRDVNGDAKKDLVLIEFGRNYPTPFKLTVLLNDGTGKFGPPIRSDAMDATLYIRDFTLADLRNTGLPDLILIGTDVNQTQGYIAFSANHGDGTFGPLRLTTITGGAGYLGVADFNGDGKLDVMIGRSSSTLGLLDGLAVLLGKGDGTFLSGPLTDFGSPGTIGGPPRAIFPGDFNHDGKMDVLVLVNDNTYGSGSLPHSLFEFLGKGDGSFQPPVTIIPAADALSVRDINNDGQPDIIQLVQPFGVTGATDLHYAVWTGRPDGTLLQGSTFAPFPGRFPAAYVLDGPTPFQNWGPLMADFNGDGNLDIAAFLFRGGLVQLQILLGNGDGTYTPDYHATEMGDGLVAQAAGDLNGDGRDDLIQLSRFVSSFHVMTAAPGTPIELRLVADPVIGSNGRVRLNLGLPVLTDTLVQLSASDPAISITSPVTIPAGTVTQDVPFTIGAAFDPAHVFALQAQLGSSVSTAYGTQATGARSLGFHFTLGYTAQSAVAGGATRDYAVAVYSVNGYSTSIQISCQGLPAGASCQLGQNPLDLPAGAFAATTLVVNTTSSMALGSYPFTVVATDGAFTEQIDASLNLSDFSLSLSPGSLNILAGSSGNFSITLNPIFGWSDTVQVSCQVAPAGPRCSIPGGFVALGALATLSIDASTAAAGDYTVTVSGAAGGVTHSVTGLVHVQDAGGSFSASSATISIGGTANFNVTLTSMNGLTGQFAFDCLTSLQGVTCNFIPASATLPANGSVTTVLTVGVTRRPSFLIPPRFEPPLSMWHWLVLWVLLSLLILGSARRKLSGRRWAPVAAAVLLIYLLAGVAACGGGGGGSGSSPPPPPPPPPQPSTTVTVTVRATSSQVTKTLGTITITVP